MSEKIIQNYTQIKNDILKLSPDANLIVVSKNQPNTLIEEILKLGHVHFGENKFQESLNKWKMLKTSYPDTKLHFIGPIQTNKVKGISNIFDYIHSLDNERLAKILSDLEDINQKKIKYFIQVNLGQETQKRGISDENLKDFIDYCHSDLKLNIIGLMCIPPDNQDPSFYFEKLSILNKKFSLPELSMGMSSDYLIALKYNATYLRIGRSIFS